MLKKIHFPIKALSHDYIQLRFCFSFSMHLIQLKVTEMILTSYPGTKINPFHPCFLQQASVLKHGLLQTKVNILIHKLWCDFETLKFLLCLLHYL